MMRYCIDRFEGDMGVLTGEDGSVSETPRAALPDGAAEGDWLVRGPDGGFAIDRAYTERVRECIRKKMDRLWE